MKLLKLMKGMMYRGHLEGGRDQSGVPVLVDPENDVIGMVESDDIVSYLERTYS